MPKTIIAILLCFALLPVNIGNAENSTSVALTPEEFMQRFYKWFFVADEAMGRAIFNDEIFNFVDDGLVKYLREKPGAVNYFLQVAHDFPLEIRIAAGKPLFMAGQRVVVPVTFIDTGAYYPDKQVIVTIKQDGDTLRIVKVSNVYPYIGE